MSHALNPADLGEPVHVSSEVVRLVAHIPGDVFLLEFVVEDPVALRAPTTPSLSVNPERMAYAL